MGVAIDNPHAKALYERLGYRDSGMGEYVSRWSYFDRDGREYWHEETCTYLVRDLP